MIEYIFCKIFIDLNPNGTLIPVVINTWKNFDFIKEEQQKSIELKNLFENAIL